MSLERDRNICNMPIRLMEFYNMLVVLEDALRYNTAEGEKNNVLTLEPHIGMLIKVQEGLYEQVLASQQVRNVSGPFFAELETEAETED